MMWQDSLGIAYTAKMKVKEKKIKSFLDRHKSNLLIYKKKIRLNATNENGPGNKQTFYTVTKKKLAV